MTSDRRQQLRAWYSDPVRKLPRKVVADVLALLDALEDEQRMRAEADRKYVELQQDVRWKMIEANDKRIQGR